MNNIPYFLSHLPIWKANAKDTVKITKRARAKEHQFDTVDKKTEEIVVKNALYVALNIVYRIDYEMLKRHAVRHVVKSYVIEH